MANQTNTPDTASIDQQIQQLDQAANAQKAIALQESKPPASFETSSSNDQQGSWWSVQDAMTISAAVLIFGAFIIALAALLIQKGKAAEDVLRIFGTVIIIISAVFLIVAGYSDKQIAPVMGLLGTIVGYLLGKDTASSKASGHVGPTPAKHKQGQVAGGDDAA